MKRRYRYSTIVALTFTLLVVGVLAAPASVADETENGGIGVAASSVLAEQSISASNSGEIIQANRTIEHSKLEPGSSMNVTVEIAADAESDPAVFETFDPAFGDLEFVDLDPEPFAAVVSDERDELVVLWEDVEDAIVQYEVSVPEESESNETYSIDGVTETNNESVNISGPNELTITEVGGGGGAPPSAPPSAPIPPAPDPEEAEFTISELDLPAGDLEPSERIVAEAVIENTGDAAGTAEYIFSRDAETIADGEVTLAAADTEVVTTDVEVPADETAVEITIETQHDSASSVVSVDAAGTDEQDAVDEADEPSDPDESDGLPGFGLPATLIGLLLSLVVFFSRES